MFGLARSSCTPWTAAALAAAAAVPAPILAAASNATSNASSAAAPAVKVMATASVPAGRPQCSALPRCTGSTLRRRVRTTRYVGGYSSNASTMSLIEELQRGPLPVSLLADATFALYSSGVYRSLERR